MCLFVFHVYRDPCVYRSPHAGCPQRALLSKWYLVARLSTDEVSVSVEIADRVLTEEQNRTL